MRAQTTIDFAVGISVFLITSVFVFAFVPGLLQPFNEGAQEETVAADRLASQLTESMLASVDEPYVLETDCTTEFFREDAAGGPVADDVCGFNQSTDLADPSGFTDRIGISDRQRLNVTIRELGGDETFLCWDGSSVIEADAGTCSVTFAAGEAPPASSSSVVTASRTVGIGGDDAKLTVKMW